MGLGGNDNHPNKMHTHDATSHCLDDTDISQKVNKNNSQGHQHYFSLCKPLRQINVYHGGSSFSTAIRVKGLMSVVKCEGCSIQFISTTEQNEIINQNKEHLTDENSKENYKNKRKRSSVEETLAAYYNTSQLESNINDILNDIQL